MTKDKTYKRDCPDCGKVIEYGWKRTYENALEKQTKCKKCTGKKISKILKGRDDSNDKSYKDIEIRTKDDKNGNTVYVRNCPECGDEITHKNKRSYRWSIKEENLCKPCSNNQISETLKKKYKDGEFIPHVRNSKLEKSLEKDYIRNCPDCFSEMYYTRKDIRDISEKNNVVCNSCSAYRYNKTWNNVITDDSIKQMRASKAGFENWDEYVEKYPKKQMYKREVWKYTYRNDLESFSNWDKRGRCGVDGAYQLDHIISIHEGYKKGIPPDIIGSVDNLRMIPWKENRQKGTK